MNDAVVTARTGRYSMPVADNVRLPAEQGELASLPPARPVS